jgi:hypothetical protein
VTSQSEKGKISCSNEGLKGGVLPTGRLLFLSLTLLFLSFCAGTPHGEKSNVLGPNLYYTFLFSDSSSIFLPGQSYSPVFPLDTPIPNLRFSEQARNPFLMGLPSPLKFLAHPSFRGTAPIPVIISKMSSISISAAAI